MLGLIGKKVGMTQVFDESGNCIPVTVIEINANQVIGERTTDKDGYEAIIMGSTPMKKNRIRKPYAGQFPKGIEPYKYLREFQNFGREVKVGDKLGIEIFEGIPFVDVLSVSKGKGFQGVMKRHGFHGGRKTHGSKFHRAGGSTGMAASPSKVFRGTKMAGRMGYEQNTVQNLKLIKIDQENEILLVKGAVPGTKGTSVLVTKSRKR